jgi:hypothetical protein
MSQEKCELFHVTCWHLVPGCRMLWIPFRVEWARFVFETRANEESFIRLLEQTEFSISVCAFELGYNLVCTGSLKSQMSARTSIAPPPPSSPSHSRAHAMRTSLLTGSVRWTSDYGPQTSHESQSVARLSSCWSPGAVYIEKRLLIFSAMKFQAFLRIVCWTDFSSAYQYLIFYTVHQLVLRILILDWCILLL